jgi:hypothetical protein
LYGFGCSRFPRLANSRNPARLPPARSRRQGRAKLSRAPEGTATSVYCCIPALPRLGSPWYASPRSPIRSLPKLFTLSRSTQRGELSSCDGSNQRRVTMGLTDSMHGRNVRVASWSARDVREIAYHLLGFKVEALYAYRAQRRALAVFRSQQDTRLARQRSRRSCQSSWTLRIYRLRLTPAGETAPVIRLVKLVYVVRQVQPL